MYGQCEATARMAYLPWEKSLEKVGGIGIAIPGGQFRLIAADGSEITETGVTGEPEILRRQRDAGLCGLSG